MYSHFICIWDITHTTYNAAAYAAEVLSLTIDGTGSIFKFTFFWIVLHSTVKDFSGSGFVF